MAADPTGRPPAKSACIYWTESLGASSCSANDFFPQEDISCFNSGNCDGFGTCRGCTKFDSGGLKFSHQDGVGGESSTPMNMRMYNIRAKVQTCCHWEGSPIDYAPAYIKSGASANLQSYNDGSNQNGTITLFTSFIPSEFPEANGRGVLFKEGTDASGDLFPVFNASYSARQSDRFESVTITNYKNIGKLDSAYEFFLATVKPKPVFKTKASGDPNAGLGERTTRCTLSAAAPWQESFTDENPFYLACNGAKAECPFYTGPAFSEVVDAKMDKGSRITAKQIMELRFYSKDWHSFGDPVALWEATFRQPYIWAWQRAYNPGGESLSEWVGQMSTEGAPRIQKVEVGDLRAKTPSFRVGGAQNVTQGTPVVGGVPDYPTLIRELEDLPQSSKVLFPQGTDKNSPFVKKAFTHGDRFFYVSAQVPTDREVFAINLTKNSQGTLPDQFFIEQTKLQDPDGISYPFGGPLPGATFNIELTTEGSTRSLNHIRIFIDTGIPELEQDAGTGSLLNENNIVPLVPSGNTTYVTLDVYVEFQFYHSAITQTYFNDSYGHKQVDPWINNFTQIEAGGDIINLTGNSKFSDVFWNTISSEGKKTVYSIIEEVTTSSDDPSEIEWEALGCNHVLVTFLNKGVNRIAPWAAWGASRDGSDFYVRVNRSSNSEVTGDEPSEVQLELAYATLDGSILPANMAIFRTDPDEDIGLSVDVDKDVLEVKYGYTVFKQGPIKDEDKPLLRDAADLNDKIIDVYPYDVEVKDSSYVIDGPFVRVGGTKFHTCQDIMGECFSKVAATNEEEARIQFFKGGIEEDNIQSLQTMIDTCQEDFELRIANAEFDDGEEATIEKVTQRLSELPLKEGSLHFLFVFEDEDGRPIGVKNTAMLCQSSIVQARDVEIKYEWGAHIRHFPNRGNLFLLASFYESIYVAPTHAPLISATEPNVPNCGDHSESTIARNGYTAFNLELDEHGAMWYPYNRCNTPRYHVSREEGNASPVEYNNGVEGFEAHLRRDYWERSRVFDKYTPFIIAFVNRIGCYWSERTSTAEAIGPFFFLGYTKIRSMHLFGQWATDRESIRVSRHWEKRNLSIQKETLTEEDGEWTLALTEDFQNILFDDDGNLVGGTDVQTPVWVHMNDSYSVVNPTSEAISNPFGHYLLQSTGDHGFAEEFTGSYESEKDGRYALDEIFVERDYTTTLDRSPDGSKIFTSDDTVVNVEGGLAVREDQGNDIRFAFSKDGADGQAATWAWLASPPPLERPIRLIGGVDVKNQDRVFFRQDRTSANFPKEGTRTLTYTPHTFDPSGFILTLGHITFEGGPPLYINYENHTLDPLLDGTGIHILSQNSYLMTDEEIDDAFEALPSEPPTPYDPASHTGADYTFTLPGGGIAGQSYIVLADNQGVKNFEVGEKVFGTLPGILVRQSINVDELPYKVLSVSKGTGFGTPGQKAIADVATTHDTPAAFSTEKIGLDGHYFVEEVVITGFYGGEFDIPSIEIRGIIYGEKSNSVFTSPTDYFSGSRALKGTRYTRTYIIGSRVTSLVVKFGTRVNGQKFNLDNIQVKYRNPTFTEEDILVYEPKVNVSTGTTGSHHPSDLEFYFSRSEPDFAKEYSYTAILHTPGAFFSAPIPETSIKFNGRLIKDIIPHFEFSDPVGGRFNFDNIDITEIEGYTTDPNAFGGEQRYIAGAVECSSKGWTMYTTDHQEDPGASLSHPNSFPGKAGIGPLQNLQKELYQEGAELLGESVSYYKNFWHPQEVEVLKLYGVDLLNYTWDLELKSTVTSMENIYKHEQYGCLNRATSEYLDGKLHEIENWQARGVFHYQCEPKYNDACIAIVMNKCNYFFWEDYGTALYKDNNVISRFSQTFDYPINDFEAYISNGLIDVNYTGGVIGGISISAGATVAGLSGQLAVRQFNMDINPNDTGPSDFQ